MSEQQQQCSASTSLQPQRHLQPAATATAPARWQQSAHLPGFYALSPSLDLIVQLCSLLLASALVGVLTFLLRLPRCPPSFSLALGVWHAVSV